MEQTGDIVIFNRSFWPDIEATGQLLTSLAEQLSKNYPITFVAGRSYYTETDGFQGVQIFRYENHKGINIIRLRHTRFWKKNLIGRLVNWSSYTLLALMIGLLKIRPKLIIVNTDPPFLGIVGMILKYWHKVPLIYNCRDLFPDIAIELGMLKEGVISRTFDFLNNKALSYSDMVVPLGNSMKQKLEQQGVVPNHIKVIPDSVDTDFLKPIERNASKILGELDLNGKFVVMYSGNIGLSQDFSSILKAAALVHVPFMLVFVGDGSGKDDLMKESSELGLKNIISLPYQPYDELPNSLNIADLHLIPLKREISGSIVPSKLYPILAIGKPYLAIANQESEPVNIAKQFGCGLWAEPGDVIDIKEKIEWSIKNRPKLLEMGMVGRKIALECYNKDKVTKEWVKTIDSLIP
jgi:putative colanic acid biosynthesis glycosyltransferase WcaI